MFFFCYFGAQRRTQYDNKKCVVSIGNFKVEADAVQDFNKLMNSAASVETCFIWCWNEHSAYEARAKLQTLLRYAHAMCSGHGLVYRGANCSDVNIIRRGDVARAVKYLKEHSDNDLYSAPEIDDAIDDIIRGGLSVQNSCGADFIHGQICTPTGRFTNGAEILNCETCR